MAMPLVGWCPAGDNRVACPAAIGTGATQRSSSPNQRLCPWPSGAHEVEIVDYHWRLSGTEEERHGDTTGDFP
jgi:hypothetical protein